MYIRHLKIVRELCGSFAGLDYHRISGGFAVTSDFKPFLGIKWRWLDTEVKKTLVLSVGGHDGVLKDSFMITYMLHDLYIDEVMVRSDYFLRIDVKWHKGVVN